MLTQSQRMTTAAEAKFRIKEPNSRKRDSLIIALDPDARSVIGDLIGLEWNGAHFHYVVEGADPAALDDVEIETPKGDRQKLTEALKTADVVMMVATHDTPDAVVKAVGENCFRNLVMTSGFVLDESGDGKRLEATLSVVRPYVVSLVVGTDEDFLIETLRAIRA